MDMVYKWKKSVVKGMNAQIVGEYLYDIEQKNDGLTPKTIVNESRPKDALLHNHFEWNDKKAAEGYREVQAQEIIRNIMVIKISKDEPEIEEVRALISIEDDEGETKYVSLPTVLSNEDLTKQMFARALRELQAIKKKYKDLQQLKPIFELIDKIAS